MPVLHEAINGPTMSIMVLLSLSVGCSDVTIWFVYPRPCGLYMRSFSCPIIALLKQVAGHFEFRVLDNQVEFGMYILY